jgi:serine/threonine protein kinase
VKRIGLGTHAEVYEVSTGIDGPVDTFSFAIKIEKPTKQSMGLLMKEIDILKSLNPSKCVPQYFGAFTIQIAGVDCLGYGMELFDDSLSSLKHGKKGLSNIQRADFLLWLSSEMFECVFTLHKAGILHRDIKPSNFLFKLSSSGQPRISVVDFGSSVSFDEASDQTFRGTGAYASPYADSSRFTAWDDYWSVVFSLLELSLNGGLPWRTVSARSEEGRIQLADEKNILLEHIRNNTAHDTLDDVPEHIKKIARELLNLSKSCELDSFEDTIKKMSFECDMMSVFESLRPVIRQPVKNLQKPNTIVSGNRNEILDNSASTGSVFVSLDEVDTRLLTHISSLASLGGNKHLAVKGKRVCVTELVTGSCSNACPLFHLPFKGIQLSAILRRLRRREICVRSVAGKCDDKRCTFLHLSHELVLSIYIDGVFPNH